MLTEAEELALMQKQRDEAWARIVAMTEEAAKDARKTFLKGNPVMTKEQAEKIFRDGLMEFVALAVDKRGTDKNHEHRQTQAMVL